jgi:hypothetical protein
VGSAKALVLRLLLLLPLSLLPKLALNQAPQNTVHTTTSPISTGGPLPLLV